MKDTFGDSDDSGDEDGKKRRVGSDAEEEGEKREGASDGMSGKIQSHQEHCPGCPRGRRKGYLEAHWLRRPGPRCDWPDGHSALSMWTWSG